jgi:hypothetical protein
MPSLGIVLQLRRRRPLAITIAIVVVAVVAWRVLASSHPAAAPAAPPVMAAATGVASDQGMRVAIQPESGALVPPSPEQAAELDALGAPKPSEPLQIERRADGTLIMHLGRQFDSYSVARIGASGKETRCFSTAESTGRFLNNDSGTAQPVLEVR